MWRYAPGLVALVLLTVMSAIIFLKRPYGTTNRRLALLLFVEAGSVGTGTSLMYLTDDPRVMWAGQAVADVLALAVPWLYLLFLATLDTPLTRPLRAPGMTRLIGGLALAAPASFFVWTSFYMPDPSHATAGPGFSLILLLWSGAGLFGLAVALSARAQASPGSAKRRLANGYAIAFGVRDAGWAVVAWLYLGFSVPGSGTYLAAAPVIAFALFLGHAILRTQLFDIDLKIKWTVNRGTLVAMFLAVFFVVTVTAENYLTDRYGWAVGGVGAGLLLFALTPLQRFADRVADATMPHVKDTSAYRLVRKQEVYVAAVQGALEDGQITTRERTVLATLADQLGLTSAEALALERRVVSVTDGGPASTRARA